jgi:hypothetical protein
LYLFPSFGCTCRPKRRFQCSKTRQSRNAENGCNQAKVLLSRRNQNFVGCVALQKRKKRKEGKFMRRFSLIVAMLLVAAPAMATVTITATQRTTVGYCDMVDITYSCSAAEEVRGIAIDAVASAGYTVQSISGYYTGEGPGYGIFPGNFRDVIDAADPCWTDPNYTPVAPSGDPDAQAGLGTNAVTLEMGALYTTGNAPASAGTLCSLQVRPDSLPGTPGTLTLTVNSTRGGVVLADGSSVTPVLVPAALAFPDCYPCWLGYAVGYGNWKSVGSPPCWCNYPYQCDGDSDNSTETIFKYRVYTGDLDAVSASWKARNTSTNLNACADFDHGAETIFKYRVYTADLQYLIDNWKKKDSQLEGGCPRQD